VAKLTLAELPLAGKRLFLRADFNVPLKGGAVADDARIRAVLPTLTHALKAGAAVVLASHLGRPDGRPAPEYSLRPVADCLENLLSQPVPRAPDCVGSQTEAQARALAAGKLLLLENLRFHPEEEANDDGFARSLAALGDCYANDAFAAAHRAHASVVAITRYLQPAAAGFLMQRELAALGRILESPERPLIAILGGAKISDKLGLIEHLVDRVDGLVIGGGMAFTFLKASGHEVGRSLVDPDRLEMARRVLATAERRGARIVLPLDVVVADGVESPGGRLVSVGEIPATQMGLDIGPRTVEHVKEVLRVAGTVVWNGPLGVFERPPFAEGTLAIARAVAEAGAFSVVGGGDTVAAIHRAGVPERIGYLSTAGGAFLEFLEGRKLPGVEALTDRA